MRVGGWTKGVGLLAAWSQDLQFGGRWAGDGEATERWARALAAGILISGEGRAQTGEPFTGSELNRERPQHLRGGQLRIL